MSMNLTRCMKGHFYDADTYASCPYCNQETGGNVTVDFESSGAAPIGTDPGKTAGLMSSGTASEEREVPESVIPEPAEPVPMKDDRDIKTISIWQTQAESAEEAFEQAPVAGWLVCVKGKALGRDFRLKSGRNFIGRSDNMDVSLPGENTVSRDRHAIVIHEPRKNIFIAQPGDSRELFYVNGEVVLSSVEMKKNDVLQVGDVQLMLIPCCDEKFRWEES